MDRREDTRVEWREWGEAAFEEADRSGKPLLLAVTASWCTHCHEMDAETYADPGITANINDGFVPVTVDADRRPRVASRYNVGGFPATVFATPDGAILTAAGYLSPEGMRGALDGARRTWDAKGLDGGRVPRALDDGDPPGGELTEAIEARLVETLRANYDERAGGWGQGAKFPMPRTVEFALKRDRQSALRTLDAIDANLLDDYDGGFFRNAANADWSDPNHEKVLDTNAALVRSFANAYLYTGEEAYREPAERAIEYLTTTLWVPDGPLGDAFAASQAAGAGVEYYGLAPTERESATTPPVDETTLVDWNALAVDGLLTYAAYTDDERAMRYAERSLSTILDELVVDGRTVHYRDGEAVGERGLLVDHARVIAACCRARQVLGADALDADIVDVARALADYALDELKPGAAFVDGPRDGPGLLDRPLRPLDGNVELADALLDLHELTGDDRYADAAREATAAFAGAHERFGPQTAGYGSVVGRLREGTLRIEVADEAGCDLHRAALRTADHEKVVVPDADGEDGAAYVVVDGERSSPAFDPETLAERVAEHR